MNWLAELLAGLVSAIGQRIFAPAPPPEPPAPAPDPPGFTAIDKRIDEEIARGKSEPPP